MEDTDQGDTPVTGGGEEVVILAIDFQDGFEEDTVTVRLDGEEIFHKADVTTKLLLGLADSVKSEVKKGPVTVELGVQTRDILDTISLDVSADIYLGVSIVNDRLEYIFSDEPFGYG